MTDGYGYVLVGVEPGRCPGMDAIDSAVLDPRIQQFLDEETGPTWQPQWVPYEETHVLVVIVDPPQHGDPIHTLQKQFHKYQAGEIFVRLKGAHRGSPPERRPPSRVAGGGGGRIVSPDCRARQRRRG